jgi:hypothetical protein
VQGRWTAEEEARLLALAAQKPGRWAEIGAALGRLPEGCRDKHRLLTGLAVAGARKGRWSAEEEARLVQLVEAFLSERQVRILFVRPTKPPTSGVKPTDPGLSTSLRCDRWPARCKGVYWA